MANYKSLTDDQLWWKSQPGNRGKDVPSPEEAAAAYGRYGRQANKNVDTVRNFLFGSSDARKKPVEDAVNARRDAGASIKLEPYVKPVPKGYLPLDMSYDEASKFSKQPPISLDEGADSISQGQTLKKGGRAKPAKKKLHPNW